MTIGSILWRRLVLGAALVCAHASASMAIVPLDVQDPTPRSVFVEWENSTDLSVVGVSYAPPVLASYSASGNVGTLVIPIASHEMMRSTLELGPVPDTFSAYTIEIDLTTLEVTSQPTSGEIFYFYSLSFTQNPLTSNGTVGYIANNSLPLSCTSQAHADALCASYGPNFCGTCEFVTGAPYDESSGEVNMVGAEDRSYCVPGCVPFVLFAEYGDLRFSEFVPPVPSLAPIALLTLVGAAIAATRGFLVDARRD